MADLMRTFSIREREPMIKLFNSYIKSKLEYCCVIWSPSPNGKNQNGINVIEKMQQAFTKNIEGLENLDYHQRLKKCNLYSMERRSERYMIIYAWQVLEGKKTDVLGLQTKLSKIGPKRSIQLGDIKKYRLDRTRIDTAIQTKILSSPMRKMERLFNCIPGHIRDIKERPTEYFKKQLDEWLRGVPDQPKCGVYTGRCEGTSNSIAVQCTENNTWR